MVKFGRGLEIYQLAKNTNPMLRKAIEWAKAIVASGEVQ